MHNRFWYLVSQKLSGEATDAERTELDALLKEHPEWHYAIQHINSFWEAPATADSGDQDFDAHLFRMGVAGHDMAAFGIVSKHAQLNPARKWWYAGIIVAASLLVAWLAVAGFGSNDHSAAAPAYTAKKMEVSTRNGDHSKTILPDGTQVWLNAGSKLQYTEHFGKTNRNVTLSGEAYFDVVKNVAMPFVISTQKINIKVTGTAFNVKAYPDEATCETALIHGRVEVTVHNRPDEKYVLKPNEKLVIRNEEMLAEQDKATTPAARIPLIQLSHLNYDAEDSIAVETAWIYNRLVFEDESFGAIATKMERWYGVTISITDKKLAATHFTYTIKNETIAEALRNLQYAAAFHYSIRDNSIVITP